MNKTVWLFEEMKKDYSLQNIRILRYVGPGQKIVYQLFQLHGRAISDSALTVQLSAHDMETFIAGMRLVLSQQVV